MKKFCQFSHPYSSGSLKFMLYTSKHIIEMPLVPFKETFLLGCVYLKFFTLITSKFVKATTLFGPWIS